MEKSKKTYRLVLCTAILLAVSMIAGTAAFWTQEAKTRNEFQLGKYSTEIVEEFESPNDWKPGVEVNKDARIDNNGTIPVYAKVTINQEWIRRENIYDKDGNIKAPAKGEAFPLIFDANGSQEYAALIKWGSEVALLSSGKAAIPSLELGLPHVTDPAEAEGKWLLVNETPDSSGNYTFYYIGALDGGESTPLLLDGVEMNPGIQASTISEDTVWDKTNQKWITTTTENMTSSYENARYTLSVTMHTVQATKDALRDMFSAGSTIEQSVISSLELFGTDGKNADYSRDDTVTEKKLYFEEVNGTMRYTPSTGTENWFMSHLAMLPGESYEDTLEIENRSKKTYDLYMQAMPLNQSKLPDELLDYIHMKVYFGSSVIYDGTAKGKEMSGSLNNLQNVILLGRFAPNAANKIRVELMLDPDIPMEYADILSQIDWKFMVEDKTPVTVDKPGSIKTGDEQAYLVFMMIAGTAFAFCAAWLVFAAKRRKNENDTGNA